MNIPPSADLRPPSFWWLTAIACGAVAIAGCWLLLEPVARWSALHTLKPTAEGAAARYTGSLFVAGGCAGLFGGLVAGLIVPAEERLAARALAGSLAAAVIAAASYSGWLMNHRWPVGESAWLWLGPLALASAIGAWIAGYLRR